MTDRLPHADRADLAVSPPPPLALDASEAGFSAVAALLWRERDVLDRLLYALVCEQLILRDGQVRWLAAADGVVRAALDGLRELELIRAIEAEDLAERLGVAPSTSLAELAGLAPEPWGSLLTDHRESLRTAVAEVTTIAAENRRMLHAGAEAAGETLAKVGSVAASYGRDGAPVGLPVGAILLDRHA